MSVTQEESPLQTAMRLASIPEKAAPTQADVLAQQAIDRAAELVAKVREADNPKQAFGDTKPSIHLVPMAVILEVARVMRLGADKYGQKNWREQPIRASTYYSAMFRHMVDWFEGGENIDPESKEHPLVHAICCAMIIRDGLNHGTLIDDRAFQEVKHR